MIALQLIIDAISSRWHLVCLQFSFEIIVQLFLLYVHVSRSPAHKSHKSWLIVVKIELEIWSASHHSFFHSIIPSKWHNYLHIHWSAPISGTTSRCGAVLYCTGHTSWTPTHIHDAIKFPTLETLTSFRLFADMQDTCIIQSSIRTFPHSWFPLSIETAIDGRLWEISSTVGSVSSYSIFAAFTDDLRLNSNFFIFE